jgi:CRP/FNR family cyclic AMP-dependent transcriptional regulator
MRSIQEELRGLPLFSEVSRSEMATISRLLTRLNLSAGKTLVSEGTFGREFMIIVEGTAEVRQGGRLIATIGPGELVGEMALLDTDGRGRRNATVTALTDLVIFVGTPQEFRWMMGAAPSVGEKVHETAASRALRAA